MLDTTVKIYTDGGGLFLFDPTLTIEYPDWFSACLSFVLDPEGDTNQTGEDWSELYPRAVTDLRRYIAALPCFPILTAEGTFFIRITDAPVQGKGLQADWSAPFVEPLCIESGALCLADVMVCFDWETGREAYDTFQFAIPNGGYRVYIASRLLPEDRDAVIGTYGTEDHPAILIRLERCDAASLSSSSLNAPFPALTFLDDFATDSRGYRPGIICRAEVSRIAGETVSLRVWLTQNTWSGFARMPLPSHKALKPGDFLHVRLLEDRHNFWRVELVEGDV